MLRQILAFTLLLLANSQIVALESDLVFLERYAIEGKQEGLREPSGLALEPNGQFLWTVSDDTKALFKISLKGELMARIPVSVKGMEGITLGSENHHLWVVKENTRELIEIDTQTGTSLRRFALRLAQAGSQERQYSDTLTNKGLEGIVWDNNTETFYVVKESRPPQLWTIRLHEQANAIELPANIPATWLSDWKLDLNDMDFSGLALIPEHNLLAVVSDKASALLLYDLSKQTFVARHALQYPGKKKIHHIKKAEGVAYHAQSHRLYVVSDAKAELYVYKLAFGNH